MFAPNPNHFNILVEADMELVSGEKETFKLSSEDSWKFRKILSSLNNKKQTMLFPDVARFALSRYQLIYPEKKVSSVHLVQLKDLIPDIHKDFRLHGSDPNSYERELFFSYKVQP